jgi:hypothetical protein
MNAAKVNKPTIDHIILLNKSAKHMYIQTLDNSIRYLKNRLENFEKSDVIHYYNKGTVISIPRRILACLKSINPTQIQLAVGLLEIVRLQKESNNVDTKTLDSITQLYGSFTKIRLSNSWEDAKIDKFAQSVNKLIQSSNSSKTLIAC